MKTLQNKYQLEETSTSLSFQPFYHYRKTWKWYAISLLIISGFLLYQWHNLEELWRYSGLTLVILILFYWIKELLIRTFVKYTFDSYANAVYKNNLIFSNRQILKLKDLIIFQHSESGGWHYAMGAKRKQFIKNYIISEEFGNDKKAHKKASIFEDEILGAILELQLKANE